MEGGIFLISHTEHSLLLASPCLFFSPSAYAHASPVSFWLSLSPPPFTLSLSLSSPLARCLSLFLPPALLKESDTVNQLVVCWGEGKRGDSGGFASSQENSPYAIWANRCKAECNKIQVWEITPRVRGGKIISASSLSLFFFFMFLSAVSLDFCLYFRLVMEQIFSHVHAHLSLLALPSFPLCDAGTARAVN